MKAINRASVLMVACLWSATITLGCAEPAPQAESPAAAPHEEPRVDPPPQGAGRAEASGHVHKGGTVAAQRPASSPQPVAEGAKDAAEALTDHVKAIVRRGGRRAQCNNLTGCPMLETLVALGRRAAPAIQEAFKTSRGDAFWRIILLRALGRIHAPGSGPFLLRVVSEMRHEPLRVEAALALAPIRTTAVKEGLEGLAKTLDPAADLPILMAVGYGLALRGQAKGEALIDRLLVVPGPGWLRWDRFRPGVIAVGRLRMQSLRPRIEALSQRADPFIRRECAAALGDLRVTEAIPALLRLRHDRVPGVRDQAQKSLVAITGLRHRNTAEQWDRWWARQRPPQRAASKVTEMPKSKAMPPQSPASERPHSPIAPKSPPQP